jgi:hypothetical protein
MSDLVSKQAEAMEKQNRISAMNTAVNAHNAVQLRAVARAAQESAQSNKAIEQNTRAMMHSNSEIARNTSQMVEISKRMESAQLKSAGLLESVDFGVRNLEQSTKDVNIKLERLIDAGERKELKDDLQRETDNWRYERDRLEEQIVKEEKEHEQSLKDLLHQFSRRLQLISELEMTNLEFYFFTKQMLETVQDIPADLLKEIQDKQFRDQVEDELRIATNKFYDCMHEQDRSDLAAIEDIERTDENEKASKLLASLEKKLDRLSTLRDLQSKMMKFASGRMDRKAFRDFEVMCVNVEKELQKR